MDEQQEGIRRSLEQLREELIALHEEFTNKILAAFSDPERSVSLDEIEWLGMELMAKTQKRITEETEALRTEMEESKLPSKKSLSGRA